MPQTPSIRYIIFVHLTALPAWLTLSRAERGKQVEEYANPIFADHPVLKVRWLDVEAFTAESSDILLVEADDLRDWNHCFEALRDTPFFAKPYFRLDKIYVGIEEGYREYEASGESSAS